MQKQVIGVRALSPETDAFARRCAEFVSTTRPFFAGEEKRPLFAHARDSGYAWIFSVYLIAVFRYIPAYLQRSDVCGCCCLWSLSRRFIQATSRRLVYMHVRRYAPRSYSQRVNHQQVSILLRIRLPDTEYLLRISCAHERIDHQAVFSNGLRTRTYMGECSTMQSSVNCSMHGNAQSDVLLDQITHPMCCNLQCTSLACMVVLNCNSFTFGGVRSVSTCIFLYIMHM